ncbi:hypothetical protein T484DRAFT_1816750 [Baffinella frigidus]|nr:hypothetical protein T484DRAFT_1816750 [Cryptophyta sp. CCMP2293]
MNLKVLPPPTARAVRPILRRPRNPASEKSNEEGPLRFAPSPSPGDALGHEEGPLRFAPSPSPGDALGRRPVAEGPLRLAPSPSPGDALGRRPVAVHGTWSATVRSKPDSAPAGLTDSEQQRQQFKAPARSLASSAMAEGMLGPSQIARRTNAPGPPPASSVAEWVGQVRLSEVGENGSNAALEQPASAPAALQNKGSSGAGSAASGAGKEANKLPIEGARP